MNKNKKTVLFKLLFVVVFLAGLGAGAPPAGAAVEGTIEHGADSSRFDHLGTGYALIGAHAELDCQSCHTDGIFTNLATQCADCHNNELAEGMSANHIPVTQSCDVCHTTLTFSITISAETIDHSAVDAMACSTCHDGVSATGKNASHVQTNLECDACHNANSWVTSSFDHSFVGDQSCVDCHNGAQATGKSSRHIATSDLCNTCHTTSNWIPVATVDHSQVLGACADCHDASILKIAGRK